MTELVGILNITPDSFSDGGAFDTVESALAQAEAMIAQGVAVIDVGAESTRPGADSLTPQEEWQRLELILPEIIRKAHEATIRVSLDTHHAGVAEKGLEAGVDWINDVSGFTDPAMQKIVAQYDGPLVMMHALSIPADPAQVINNRLDPVTEVISFFQQQPEILEKEGIDSQRIILDPGIGFGKTAMQSLMLLARWQELRALGLPILMGHSRKSFFSLFTEKPAEERDELTLAFSSLLAMQGVDYLRVHNVASHARLLEQFD